jgi:hypothetical protein
MGGVTCLRGFRIPVRRTCAKPCSLRPKRCVSARYRSSPVSGAADASQTTTTKTSTRRMSLVQTAQGRAPLEAVTSEGSEGPSAPASDLTGLYAAFGAALEVDVPRDRPSCPDFSVRGRRPQSTPATRLLDPCSRGEHERSAVPSRAGSRSRASQPRTSVRRVRIQDDAVPCRGVLRAGRTSGRLLRATIRPLNACIGCDVKPSVQEILLGQLRQPIAHQRFLARAARPLALMRSMRRRPEALS